MDSDLIIGDKFLRKVIPHINSARESIDIIVFYWTFSIGDLEDPVTRLILALQEAVKRGVTVRILCNSFATGDRLTSCGFRVRHLYTSKLMHPKVMILDNEKAVIGSHNYTTSGFTQNMEVSVIVPLKDDKNVLTTFFNNLWGI